MPEPLGVLGGNFWYTSHPRKMHNTEHFLCRIPVRSIFQPFPPSETHTHTHSLSHSHSELPLTPPVGQRCPELHQPFMSSRGHSWAPTGGSLPGLPSEDPIGACGSLWWTFSQEQPPLEGERTLGAGMDCGHGGWDCSCHLRFSCASLCVCTVVAWVYGFLCDHLLDPSIVCVVYVCAM